MTRHVSSRRTRKPPSYKPKVAPVVRWNLGAPIDAPWTGVASWVVIALGALSLAIVAGLVHVVGDYSAESDFYGGYVQGARLFQLGQPDPSHYRVVGPVYDLLLGVLAWVTRDFFVAAQAISIASALATWVVWRNLVKARFGGFAALVTTALFVVNPVFFQYGYSVVSHGLAVCIQTAALAVLLRASGRGGRVFLAGCLAGVATLVRYPGAILLPASWLILFVLERPVGRSPWRAALLHLAGFLVLISPWVAFSASHGVVPGEVLYERAAFYLSPAGSHNVQDAPVTSPESDSGRDLESLGEVIARSPGEFLAHTVTGAGRRLVLDARNLLGLPVALLALLGGGLAIWDGTWRRLAPLGAPWLFHFCLLAPVFYSPLYSLPLLPFYLTAAGAGMASGRMAMVVLGTPLKPLLAVIAVVLGAKAAVEQSRFVHSETPFEVRQAGLVLASHARPGDRVMARKAHIGYYSGLGVVAFPRFDTLSKLAEYCRQSEVGWIYFSWYEGLLRREFWYLLDTTAAVPGLELVYHTRHLPSYLYRITPRFGEPLEWMSDEHRKAVHVARVAVQVLDDSLAWNFHLLLGDEAWRRQDVIGMLEHAEAAIRGRPSEADAWAMKGSALHAMGRSAEARTAYRNALRLNPGLELAKRALTQLE